MNHYEKRIREFNDKINHFTYHNRYEWLRQYADDVIRYATMSGYLQIKADDFIDRIINMPIDYIEDWLDQKNYLEWKETYQ